MASAFEHVLIFLSSSLLEVTRDLDQSMSMSFHYPKPTPRPSVAHTMAPSQVPISASSSSPTSSFSLTNSPTGTGQPSGSASPSKPPSHSPSGSSAPSFRPSLSSIGVFECTDQGVVRVDKAGDETTPIHLTIAYEAEVNRTTYSVQALAELELALLEAAIAGALDCASPHRERRVLEDQGRILLTSTDKLGTLNMQKRWTAVCRENDFVANLGTHPQVCAIRLLPTPTASFCRLIWPLS